MQELKMILGSAMIIFFLIIAIADVLIIASDFTRKYKSMKRKAKGYERLIKIGRKLYA